MVKKKNSEIIMVLCRADSLEPDSAPYKPTKPVLRPECWVQVPVPIESDGKKMVLGTHTDGLPILSLEGWAYLIAEARAAQKEIYG